MTTFKCTNCHNMFKIEYGHENTGKCPFCNSRQFKRKRVPSLSRTSSNEGCSNREMKAEHPTVRNAQLGDAPKVPLVILHMRNADEVFVRWQPAPVGVEEYEDEWVPLTMMRQMAPQLVIDFLLHKMQFGTVKEIGKMF